MNGPDVFCPCCGGPPVLLGQLGRVTWVRCRDCSISYRIDETPDPHESE